MVNRFDAELKRGSVLLCAAVLLFGGSSAVLAQEGATPAAQATPETAWDVPAPGECLIEPREPQLFPDGVGQRAPATPLPLPATPAVAFVVPDSDPVTPEIEAAVTATVRESIACRNANQMLRAYALFTEPMIGSLFGGPSTIDPEIRALIQQGDDLARSRSGNASRYCRCQKSGIVPMVASARSSPRGRSIVSSRTTWSLPMKVRAAVG